MKSFSGAEAGRRGIDQLGTGFGRDHKSVNKQRKTSQKNAQNESYSRNSKLMSTFLAPRLQKKLSSIRCPLHGYLRLWLNYNGYLIRRPIGPRPPNSRRDLAVPSLGTLKQSPRPGSLKTFSHCLDSSPAFPSILISTLSEVNRKSFRTFIVAIVALPSSSQRCRPLRRLRLFPSLTRRACWTWPKASSSSLSVSLPLAARPK